MWMMKIQPTSIALELNTFQKKLKTNLLYNNLFSPNKYGKNLRTISKYFSTTKNLKLKKICCVISCKYRKFKNSKISYISNK